MKEALYPVAVTLAVWVGIYLVLHLVWRRFVSQRGGAVPALIRRVVLWLLWVFALIIILKLFQPDLNLTGLVIGSTIFSAVIGLALQDSLVNFLSGVVFAVEKPFRLNDWVMVGGEEGVVTEISWRTTKIRTRDNNLVIIPNSVIAREKITNFDYPSRLLRRQITVGVDYRHPPRLVRQALIEAARRVREVLDTPPPDVRLLEFGDFSIAYGLKFWMEGYENIGAVASRLRMEISEVFRRQGIRIPFPVRDLHLSRSARDEVTRPRLAVVEGEECGKEFPIGEKGFEIGRAEGSGLCLHDPEVSKQHARIRAAAGRVLVEDMKSRTGTRVNGVKIDTFPLRSGDEIEIAGTRMVFRLD